MQYYAVHTGNTPGIYMSWDAARKEVEGYSGAVYKCCKNIIDAEHFMLHGKLPSQSADPPVQSETKTFALPVKLVNVQQIKNAAKPIETKAPVSPVKSKTPKPTKAAAPIAAPPAPTSELERYIKQYYSHTDFKPEGTKVHIYTDGGTIGNGKHNATGGYGVFIPGTKIVKERLISRKMVNGKITNGVAELKAMIKALEEILLIDIEIDPDIELEFIIHYDSTYAADVITGTKVARTNIELVEKGQLLLAECSDLNIRFEHVYSHTGKQDLFSIGNEVADKLAGMPANG